MSEFQSSGPDFASWGPPAAPTQAPPQGPPSAPDPWNQSFVGLLHCEWLKLATMTSTWVLVGISFALAVYTTATSARASMYLFDVLNDVFGSEYGVRDLSSAMTTAPIYSGVLLALLGTLSITNEYSSGMIRTTLTITPSRWPALAAKAIVVATFAFLSSAIAEFLGASLSYIGLEGVRYDLFLPSGLRIWLGGALVLALMAMLGMGLGALIRSTAVSIVAYFGIMLVLPILFLFGAAAGGRLLEDSFLWVFFHLPAVAPFGAYTPLFDEEVADGVSSVSTTIATLVWTLTPLGFGFLALMKRDA